MGGDDYIGRLREHAGHQPLMMVGATVLVLSLAQLPENISSPIQPILKKLSPILQR
jgi:hypothetical protein